MKIAILFEGNPKKPGGFYQSLQSASILNLVELWKDEESRNKMIKIAEIRKKNISSEINRLSSMEEIKSRIMGISEEEVLNG